MKKTITKRIVCICTCAFLLLQLSPFSFHAVNISQNDTYSKNKDEEIIEDIMDDLPIIAKWEVPQIIGYKTALSEKFTRRAFERETEMNQLIFQRQDGTFTQYLLSFPVKYIDSAGKTRDKAFDISETKDSLYSYQTTKNDTTIRFGAMAKSGVELSSERFSIKLTPFGNINTENISATNTESTLLSKATITQSSNYSFSDAEQVNAVAYAVSPEIQIAFLPTYTGLQMQLSKQSETIGGEIAFLLETNGVAVIENEDEIILVDRNATPRAVLGNFITEEGLLVPFHIRELQAGQKYLLSVSIPSESRDLLLTSDISQIYDNLIDASIYSNLQTAYGYSSHLYIGKRSTAGIGRALIRANNWYLTETAYPGYMITSAVLTMRDIMGNDPQVTMLCTEFTGNIWNEATATWNSVNGNSFGATLSQNTMSASIGWNCNYVYQFDFTPLAERWYSGQSNWQKGIMLKQTTSTENTSTVTEQVFASCQYATESYRPRFQITYDTNETPLEDGVYRLKNISTQRALSVKDAKIFTNSSLTVVPTASDEYEQLWRIHSLGNGTYTLRPLHYTPSALRCDATEVLLLETGPADNSTLPAKVKWSIVPSGDGNTFFVQRGNSKTMGVPTPSSGIGSEVYVYSLDTEEQEQYWQFQKINNINEEIRVYDAVTESCLSSNNTGNHTATDSEFGIVLLNETVHLQSANPGLRFSVCSGGEIDSLFFYDSMDNSVAELITYGQNPLLQANSTGQVQILGEAWTGTQYIGVDIQIYVVDKSISLVNYYDNSFSRYPELTNAILGANALAARIYGSQFGVYLDTQGQPSYFTNATWDQCPAGIDSPCTDALCGTHANHHKNLSNIQNALYASPREDDQVTILWTYRASGAYCTGGSSHLPKTDALAYVPSTGDSIIHFITLDDNWLNTTEKRIKEMSLVLVHELAHTFGLEDQYQNEPHQSQSIFCVMKGGHITNLDSCYRNAYYKPATAFCPTCTTALASLVPQTHHTGNQ